MSIVREHPHTHAQLSLLLSGLRTTPPSKLNKGSTLRSARPLLSPAKIIDVETRAERSRTRACSHEPPEVALQGAWGGCAIRQSGGRVSVRLTSPRGVALRSARDPRQGSVAPRIRVVQKEMWAWRVGDEWLLKCSHPWHCRILKAIELMNQYSRAVQSVAGLLHSEALIEFLGEVMYGRPWRRRRRRWRRWRRGCGQARARRPRLQ